MVNSLILDVRSKAENTYNATLPTARLNVSVSGIENWVLEAGRPGAVSPTRIPLGESFHLILSGISLILVLAIPSTSVDP